jgi:toxin FitB
MNIVDSSGWIEYFQDGSNAHFFENAIRDTTNLLVPSICIYEVCKRLLLTHGQKEALRAVGVMGYGREIALVRDTATAAALISVELKLAMADSIILATARELNATLWTQDPHFEKIPGVKYIAKAM